MVKNDKKRTADFFNRLGHEYVEGTRKEYRSIYEHSTSLIRGYLKGRILDLGSGGVDHFDDFAGEFWVCCDIACGLLSLHEKSDSRKSVCGETAKLPFKDNSFDVVLISFALHHFAQDKVAGTFHYLRETFSEVSRVCCPGGKLIVVENTILPLLGWIQRGLYPLVRFALYLFDQPSVFLVTASHIESLFSDTGFRIQKRISFRSDSKGLVFPGTIPRSLSPISFYVMIGERL